jgi:peptide/nickel transport system substrate-binding protein
VPAFLLLKRTVAGAGACLFLALAIALGSSPPSARADYGTLTIGVSQFASTLHPSIEASVAKSYILDMARRPFTAFDADWQLICMLCTELPTLENGLAVLETTPEGDEGIALTYMIQPGASWGDGTPVSSEDVVFTWEVGRHPQSPFDNIELYRSLYAIDVVDETTFTLHFDKVTFQYNAINDLRVLPAHLERPVYEAAPEAYRERTLYNADPTNPGLYFGPYRIAEQESGVHTILVPNETWYGDPPHFGRIVVRVIENTAAIQASLQSGDIDMIAGESGITLDQALALEPRLGPGFTMIFKPGLFYEHIDLNLDNPLLQDRRVRRALLLALDRETLVEQLFQGQQPVAHGNVSPLDWVYDPDAPHTPYDPAAAAALLDEAGFPLGSDGVRRDAEGRALSFELMTTAGDRTRELVEQVLAAFWADIGIEITIRNEPARVFFGRTVSERRFSAMAMFAWVSSPENVPRTVLHTDHIPTAENGWAGQNYTGFSDPEMDALIEAIEVELDPEARRAMWYRLQEIYAEELPVLPLYFRAQAYVLPDWLEGVVPTGHQNGSTLWVEQWHRRVG